MRLQLTVPKRCHEDWANMSVRATSRFCASCQHEVADLTHATDSELLRLFGGKEKAPKCARFDPRQLDRMLRSADERSSSMLPIAAFTTLLALLSGTEATGQKHVAIGKPMPGRVERPVPHRTPAEHARALAPRTITIHGRLISASTGAALPEGTVRLWSGERELQNYSGPSGHFTITFEAKADSAELFFGGPDRDPFTQFVSWAEATNNGPITIDMGEVKVMCMARINTSEMILGEVAVMRRPTWRFRTNKP